MLPSRRRHERGFAIILVLWLLVVLSAIGVQLIAGGRSELQIAFNLDASAQAEALADGGVAQAVFALADPNAERRWYPNGESHRLTLGGHRILITVRDENAKINPNLASAELMTALFHEIGVERATAEAMAVAIDARVRPPAASGTPANERPQPVRFDSIEELTGIPNMTPAMVAALRSHISMYSSAAVPVPGTDAVVSRAVMQSQSRTGGGHGAGANPTAPTQEMTVSIISDASRVGRASFRREAVVQLDSMVPKGYAVLRWARGETDED